MTIQKFSVHRDGIVHLLVPLIAGDELQPGSGKHTLDTTAVFRVRTACGQLLSKADGVVVDDAATCERCELLTL